MTTRYEVRAAQIVVKVPGAQGGEAYLRRGRLLPATVEKAEVKRLLELELIGATDIEVTEAETVTTPADPNKGDGGEAPAAPVDVPNGEPGKSWTHAQIDAWAAAQNPPVVLDADASSTGKLEAIAAVKAG